MRANSRVRVCVGKTSKNMEVALRNAVCKCLSQVVCYASLHPNVDSFKLHKLHRIAQSTTTIQTLQSFDRPVVRWGMQFVSLCGEEEFYLLALPVMIWTKWFEFGVELTILVTMGFLLGNVLKDLFQLPRPLDDAKIWRISLNTREFGFPSTHAMNAVSIVMLMETSMVASALWIALMSTSRMFLGMHSGTDIRGGWVLGVVVYLLHKRCIFPGLHYVWYEFGLLPVLLGSLGGAFGVLLVCPQPPREQPTLSFGQNGLILGVLVGIVVGKKLVIEYQLDRLTLEQDWVLGKCVFGFAVLGCVR
ncbi:hypothetical protein BASA81_010555 [Batrachochytrium salamandrivorans]|nr:hypothetical protein BASA81_010555 [Batrachochytrium salamandrivorans]